MRLREGSIADRPAACPSLCSRAVVGKKSLVAVVCLAVFACLPSCSAIVGIHTRTAALVGCAACVDSACEYELGVCKSVQSCATWIECDRACDVDDVACRAGCAGGVEPAASSAIVAVQHCQTDKCTSDCDVKCGGTPVLAPEASAVSCDGCVQTKCCGESQTCAQIGDCWDVRACLRQSGGPDAALACAGPAHQTGGKPSQSLDQCVKQGCAVECGIGAYWSCVGRVMWPPATRKTVTAIYSFQDASTNKGAAGLHVRACPRDDVDCAAPIVPQTFTTDDTGTVTITVPATTAAGFDGYFEIVDPAGKYLPGLLYEGAPLADDLALRPVKLLSKATIESLATFGQITLSPDRGFIGVGVFDCAASTAPQMTVASDTQDASTKVFYIRGTLIDPAAIDTDTTGGVAFINAPSGKTTLTATSELLRRAVIRSSVVVRKGAITLLQMTPSPEF